MNRSTAENQHAHVPMFAGSGSCTRSALVQRDSPGSVCTDLQEEIPELRVPRVLWPWLLRQVLLVLHARILLLSATVPIFLGARSKLLPTRYLVLLPTRYHLLLP